MTMVVFSALFLALPPNSPADVAKGVVFVASGIGGLDPLPFHAHWALPLAKVGHEIREVEWQAFMDDLRKTLDRFGVGPSERTPLIAIVESTKADIVRPA